MKARRKRLVVVAAVAIVLLASSSHIRVACMTALVMAESMTPDVDGPIARLRPDPVVEPVTFEVGEKTIVADIYIPSDDGQHPGIVLNHGVATWGKDDPRLVNFADAMARAGYVALVPQFTNLAEFRVRPSDVEEIIASYEYLEARPEVKRERIGLFGFSYAGGLALLAAGDSRIAERVRFCFLLGAYYDLEHVVTYMTTGMYEEDGRWVYLEPRNTGRWAFLLNSADLVDDEDDRALIVRISRMKLNDPTRDVSAIADELGAEGRRVYAVMVNEDPDRTPALIAELSRRIRDYFGALSLPGKMDGLKAHLIIGHGRDDDLIPYTESVLLAEHAPMEATVRLTLLDSFHHVDITLGEGRGVGAFFASVAEVRRLFSMTYDLLAQGLL